jgi:DNA-binding NarL/FixJ family response regulator
MMDEQIIRSVTLYFYLNLFDSRAAFSASQKVLSAYKDLASDNRSDLIPLAQKILGHSRGLKIFSPQGVTGEFSIPKNLNIDAWMDFHKRADSAEYESVLWSQVLGFTDEEVAEGLTVTEGTVRHRVSRGLRELGRRI